MRIGQSNCCARDRRRHQIILKEGLACSQTPVILATPVGIDGRQVTMHGPCIESNCSLTRDNVVLERSSKVR